MAKKISQLELIDHLSGNEEIPLSFGSANYKVKTISFASLISKTSLGLDKVNNTADEDKPLSKAGREALAGKADATAVTALQTAMASKAETIHSHSTSDINGFTEAMASKAAVSHKHEMSDINGLSSAFASLNSAYESVATTIVGVRQDIELLIRRFETLPTEFNIGAIIGLSEALAGKADAEHKHAVTDINGLDDHIVGVIAARGSIPVKTSEW